MQEKSQAKETLRELLDKYEAELAKFGLRPGTRLNLVSCANALICRHEKAGKDELDGRIIAEYFEDISKREYTGSRSKSYGYKMERELKRFLHFAKTGEAKLANPTKGSRYALIPEFERIANDFLDKENYHPNTRNDARWVVYKYFSWLNEQDYKNLELVKSEQLQKFLVECAQNMAMGSVASIKLHLSKLYAYLFKKRLSESSYGELLSFTVARGSKVPNLHTRTEIASLLDAIDQDTALGKRAYAVMLLGIVFGFRASDVVNLSLNDIDWINGEIKILQAKTSETVCLPLTRDVGEALQDYILNIRPKSTSNKVFIRNRAPYEPIKSAVTIGEIYRDCCKAAGIPASKQFHNLRRSLGTSLVTTGSPITMVAQVLGHSNADSTKKYIALDSDNLKICALSFDGIAPISWHSDSLAVSPCACAGGDA